MNEQQGEQQVVEPKRPKAKKILTVVAIALVILLPTILAVALAIYSELHEDTSGFEGVEVVLYDKDRKELFRESGDSINNESDSLVKIMCAIDAHREKYAFTVDDTKVSEPLIASIIRDGAVTELTCYFSFYNGHSWCVDANGERYIIPDMYSEYFIHSSFAESLYASAMPPALYTNDGDRIYPQQATWTYRNESSEWLPAVLAPTISSSEIYPCTGDISLSFSEAPSQCTVKLYEQNVEIYSGDIDGISSVSLSENIVRVSIEAAWNKKDDVMYYGTQTYSFFVRVQNKADFLISSTSIATNHPVLVCATNVTELSSLHFTSEDTSFKPEFHLHGTTAFALIPYPADVAQNQLDAFSFTLTYGVATHTFTLKHNDLGDSVNAEVCELLDINLDYFRSTISDVFVGGDHAEPDAQRFTPGRKFSDTITIDGKSIATPFSEYLSTKPAIAVKSCYAGKVAFVGSNETLGNYMVIDLGLDIKLWYCFLGEIYVKSGDVISMGEMIGTTGSITIREDGADGFAFMFSYMDHVISPDFVFGNKFVI